MLSIRDSKHVVKKVASKSWEIARSPRVVSFLKLGVALIGVVHAVEELLETPKSGKIPIGFRKE